jgi:hypothetical protein
MTLRMTRSTLLHLALALAWAVPAPSSFAALGGHADSITQDGQRLGAAFSGSRTSRFALYSLRNPDGLQVRQYASAAGLVFGVAWDGPVLPDMEGLLGNYFPLYQEGQRQKSRGVRVHQSSIVIESGGMMRSFVGRAYLPEHLPAGVTAGDIR